MTAVSFLTLVACSDPAGGHNGGAPADPNKYCDVLCTRTIECTPGRTEADKPECMNVCATPKTTAAVAELREDFAVALEDCFRSSPCEDVSIGATALKCLTSTQDSFPASSSVEELCDRFQDMSVRCGIETESGDRLTCLKSFAPFSEDVISRVRACTTGACEDVSQCLRNAHSAGVDGGQ